MTKTYISMVVDGGWRSVEEPVPTDYDGYLLLYCPDFALRKASVYQVVYFSGNGIGNDECGSLIDNYEQWGLP